MNQSSGVVRAIVDGVFTPTERQDVANKILAIAQADRDISAGAVVGAAAAGALDAVTGIDLLFAAASGAILDDLRARWTELLHSDFGAVHRTVEDGAAIYLLPKLLTARITFVPEARFGPRHGEPFHQVFGQAGPQVGAPSGSSDLVGPAWLGALRTRAALYRGDGPAAAIALDGLRDALVALAGTRTGAPAGFLEPADRDRIRATEPTGRDAAALGRAFAVAVQLLDAELQVVAPAVADAVALPLLEEAAG